MSQQRALPQKIVATTSGSAARSRTAPQSRAPRALVGALLAAGLIGLSPASADPDGATGEPAPVAPVAFPSPAQGMPALPQGLSALPQGLGQMAANPQVINAATSYLPALIGAVSEPGVRDTVQTQLLLQQVQNVIGQANLPPEYQNSMVQAAALLRNQEPPAMPAPAAPNPDQGPAPGSPALPSDDSAPKIQEFMVPTIGMNCIEGSDGEGAGNAIGKALVTAGPQEAPAPGPKEGEAGYVFTALGTGPAVTDETHPLSVNWFNLDTGAKGQATLLPNPAINATTGPATFTAIIPTGKGRVLSTVFGTVTAKNTEGEEHACTITPTVGMSRI
ncbi:MAG: Rv1157c family protein [Segniliparus sp.]|uniref:Rv1157c family protein n=1 Tax=Segniliparus sp. TaxID=2804064 RepID=UPI003F368F42